MLIYVDDIVIMSTNGVLIEKVKLKISKLFEIRDLGSIKYYLGIQINKCGNVYCMNQEKFINEILEQYGMQDASISNVPISTSYGKSKEETLLPTNKQYQSLIESLLYIAINTRPDNLHIITKGFKTKSRRLE